MKKRILTVGLDVTLADSRAALLNKHYETVIVTPFEALHRLRAEHFDLLLVCYTTQSDDALEIIQTAHEMLPKLCIVHLRSLAQQPLTSQLAHRLVTLNYHPDGWLRAVNELLAPVDMPSIPDSALPIGERPRP